MVGMNPHNFCAALQAVWGVDVDVGVVVGALAFAPHTFCALESQKKEGAYSSLLCRLSLSAQ